MKVTPLTTTIISLVLTLPTLLTLAKARAEMDRGVSPTLINARNADPREFPASVRAGGCSATIVGPRVLLIAAHCLGHGATTRFTVGPNSYSAICSHAPLYRRRVDHDIALCAIDRDVTGIPYENISLDPFVLSVSDEVLLTGYGCIRQGGGGGNDGVYRIGESRVSRLPTANSWDIITRGGAALCFGDSGGPAFKFIDDDKKFRVVISANSKGNIRDTSYLAATFTPDSISFIDQWSTQTGFQICGVHEDTPNCRPLADEPEEPELPEVELAPACENIVLNRAELLDEWSQCLFSAEEDVDLMGCDEINDLMQHCYATKW